MRSDCIVKVNGIYDRVIRLETLFLQSNFLTWIAGRRGVIDRFYLLAHLAKSHLRHIILDRDGWLRVILESFVDVSDMELCVHNGYDLCALST